MISTYTIESCFRPSCTSIIVVGRGIYFVSSRDFSEPFSVSWSQLSPNYTTLPKLNDFQLLGSSLGSSLSPNMSSFKLATLALAILSLTYCKSMIFPSMLGCRACYSETTQSLPSLRRG